MIYDKAAKHARNMPASTNMHMLTAIAPHMPPKKCTELAPLGSSTCMALTALLAYKYTGAAMMPMMTAPYVCTTEQPDVIATSPAQNRTIM